MTKINSENDLGHAMGRWSVPRHVPGLRAMRVSLRTLHIAAFCCVYGGVFYRVDPSRLGPGLLAAVLTGAALMALEIYRMPLWVIQIRGVATVVKLGLLVAASPLSAQRIWLLTAVIGIGGVVSHMPGRYRYLSVVHGRTIGEPEPG